MSNIEKILKQAVTTFTKSQLACKYQESFNALVQSVGKLTGEDLGIDSELVRCHSCGPDLANPVGYISVYEDTNILVSVFVLKANSVIPLHDHPVMYGILKVLHGSVRIQSYSPITENIKPRNSDFMYPLNNYYEVSKTLYPDPILVHRNSPVVLSPKDGCGVLTPFKNNIHEVSSVNGPSAFLDILAPPYNAYIPYIGPRHCLYFNVENHSDSESTLSMSACHPNYWTVELPYKGPKITI